MANRQPSIFQDEIDEIESSILSSSSMTSTRSGLIQAVTTKAHEDLVAEREKILKMAQQEEDLFNQRRGTVQRSMIFNPFAKSINSSNRTKSTVSRRFASRFSNSDRTKNDPMGRKTPALRSTLYQYLSVSTEEAEFNICAEHGTIHPLSKFRQYWDVISIIIIIQICVQIPFQLSFHTEKYNYESRNDITAIAIRMFTDLFFLVDLYINFITAYFDDCDNLIPDTKSIQKNYFSGWFAIDLIAALPLDVWLEMWNVMYRDPKSAEIERRAYQNYDEFKKNHYGELIPGPYNPFQNLYSDNSYYGKSLDPKFSSIVEASGLLKMARLTRLLKLFRLTKVVRSMHNIEDFLNLDRGVILHTVI